MKTLKLKLFAMFLLLVLATIMPAKAGPVTFRQGDTAWGRTPEQTGYHDYLNVVWTYLGPYKCKVCVFSAKNPEDYVRMPEGQYLVTLSEEAKAAHRPEDGSFVSDPPLSGTVSGTPPTDNAPGAVIPPVADKGKPAGTVPDKKGGKTTQTQPTPQPNPLAIVLEKLMDNIATPQFFAVAFVCIVLLLLYGFVLPAGWLTQKISNAIILISGAKYIFSGLREYIYNIRPRQKKRGSYTPEMFLAARIAAYDGKVAEALNRLGRDCMTAINEFIPEGLIKDFRLQKLYEPGWEVCMVCSGADSPRLEACLKTLFSDEQVEVSPCVADLPYCGVNLRLLNGTVPNVAELVEKRLRPKQRLHAIS